MLAPPHSLHRSLLRLCSHCPAFPPRARLPPPLLPPSSPSGAARLLPPSPLCSPAPLLPPEPPECPDRPPPRPPPLLCPTLPTLASLRALAEHLSSRPLPLPLLPPTPAPALVATLSLPAPQAPSSHKISAPSAGTSTSAPPFALRTVRSMLASEASARSETRSRYHGNGVGGGGGTSLSSGMSSQDPGDAAVCCYVADRTNRRVRAGKLDQLQLGFISTWRPS